MVRFVLPVAVLALLASLPVAAEQGTAKILAPWEANGQIYQVAVDKLQFIGTFEGIMYIEHGEGLLDAALFTCPSTMITEVLSNETKGHGYCTIESPNGDFIYAEFTCNGAPGACAGTFTLTGGTGKLTGITGESDIIVRTALSGTTVDPQGMRHSLRRQGARHLAGAALRDPGQGRRHYRSAGYRGRRGQDAAQAGPEGGAEAKPGTAAKSGGSVESPRK